MATDKQLSFIHKLDADRQVSSLPTSALYLLTRARKAPAGLSSSEASKLIDAMLKLPAVTKQLKAGMYNLADGTVVKVQQAVHGSGNLYAKRLNVTTQTFEYETGLISRVRTSGAPMTLEQAKAFGQVYGMCCVCGATLTDEKSIAAGIGPVCATKF